MIAKVVVRKRNVVNENIGRIVCEIVVVHYGVRKTRVVFKNKIPVRNSESILTERTRIRNNDNDKLRLSCVIVHHMSKNKASDNIIMFDYQWVLFKLV